MSRVSLRQGRDGRLQLRILAFFERIGVNFQVGVVIDLDRYIRRDADARQRDAVRGLIMAGRNGDSRAVAQDEGLLKESYLMDTGEWYLDSAEYGQLFGELGGVVQFRNATTVLGAINLLNTIGVNIPTEAVREGFEHVVELTGLMGRWQVLQENPKVVCDTGHNVGGWQYLNIQLEEELKRHKHLFMIVGMVNDKDIDGVLDLMPEKAFYFFTQASVQRAMPAEDFATKAIFHGLSGTICDSVQEAVEKALARAGQDDIIFIGGSTFVVADALPLFLKRDK